MRGGRRAPIPTRRPRRAPGLKAGTSDEPGVERPPGVQRHKAARTISIRITHNPWIPSRLPSETLTTPTPGRGHVRNDNRLQ